MTPVLRVLVRCLLAALAAAGPAPVCLAAADAKLTLAQCNRVPAINWVIAEPVGRTVPEFLAALQTDAALASRFAGLTSRMAETAGCASRSPS